MVAGVGGDGERPARTVVHGLRRARRDGAVSAGGGSDGVGVDGETGAQGVVLVNVRECHRRAGSHRVAIHQHVRHVVTRVAGDCECLARTGARALNGARGDEAVGANGGRDHVCVHRELPERVCGARSHLERVSADQRGVRLPGPGPRVPTVIGRRGVPVDGGNPRGAVPVLPVSAPHRDVHGRHAGTDVRRDAGHEPRRGGGRTVYRRRCHRDVGRRQLSERPGRPCIAGATDGLVVTHGDPLLRGDHRDGAQRGKARGHIRGPGGAAVGGPLDRAVIGIRVPHGHHTVRVGSVNAVGRLKVRSDFGVSHPRQIRLGPVRAISGLDHQTAGSDCKRMSRVDCYRITESPKGGGRRSGRPRGATVHRFAD